MLAKNELNKWDELYASNSSIEFVHFILIPTDNDQTLSTYFSAICPAVATQWY